MQVIFHEGTDEQVFDQLKGLKCEIWFTDATVLRVQLAGIPDDEPYDGEFLAFVLDADGFFTGTKIYLDVDAIDRLEVLSPNSFGEA